MVLTDTTCFPLRHQSSLFLFCFVFSKKKRKKEKTKARISGANQRLYLQTTGWGRRLAKPPLCCSFNDTVLWGAVCLSLLTACKWGLFILRMATLLLTMPERENQGASHNSGEFVRSRASLLMLKTWLFSMLWQLYFVPQFYSKIMDGQVRTE